MSCENTQQRLKSYFEDMLTEEEYQGVSQHLAGCTSCRQFASTTGSLSYLIKELGDLDVPKDLLSTVRFRMEQQGQKTAEPSAEVAAPRPQPAPVKEVPKVPPKESPNSWATPLLVAFICISIALSLFGFYTIFNRAGLFEGGTTADDNAAEAIPSAPQESAAPAPVEKVPPAWTEDMAEEETAKVQPALTPPAVNKPFALHWHIPYTLESQKEWLLNTIRLLNITFAYEDEDFLVFHAGGAQLRELIDGIQLKTGLSLSKPEFILDARNDEETLPVSIFLIDQAPDTQKDISVPVVKKDGVFVAHNTDVLQKSLDWHILVIPRQREAVLDAVRQGEGEMLYESREAAVFKVSGKKFNGIINEIESLGGVYPNFETTAETNVPENETGKVLISFGEK